MTAIYNQKPFSLKTSRAGKNCRGILSLQILPPIKVKLRPALTGLVDNLAKFIVTDFEGATTQIYTKKLSGIPIKGIIWIEHYDKNSYRHEDNDKEIFTEMILSWGKKSQKFCYPLLNHCDQDFVSLIKNGLNGIYFWVNFILFYIHKFME